MLGQDWEVQRDPPHAGSIGKIDHLAAGAGGQSGLDGSAPAIRAVEAAALKQDLLLEVLDFPHGLPGKDIFRRVLAALQPGAFQACFASWLESLRAAAAATKVEQPVYAVDGKTARRSHDRLDELVFQAEVRTPIAVGLTRRLIDALANLGI